MSRMTVPSRDASLHWPQACVPGLDQLLFSPHSVQHMPGRGPLLAGLTGLDEWPAPWRDLARALWPTAATHPEPGALARLVLDASVHPEAVPQLGEASGFSIEMNEATITLQAASGAAVVHALHTLSEAWHAAQARGVARWPAMRWADAPAYPWRGLMVDVVRRPLPMDALLRLLDTMAAARLNVLHWHLTDDQGWRLESARFPRLHQLGGADFHYSLQQAHTLVKEAAWRGIRVVPELDLPGHCWALGLAYPDLLCEPRPQQPQRGFGVFPCAVDPELDGLYTFIDGLIGEWADVFPDRYIHMGGDELAPQAWQLLASERGTTVPALQRRYVSEVTAILTRHGRRLVAWDELAEAPDCALPPGSVLQAWRGESALRFQPDPAIGRLRSAAYYLDQVHPAAWRWRARPDLQAPVSAPDEGAAWRLQARLGCWDVQGLLWLGDGGSARLALSSTGTLLEGLAPVRLPDALHQWRLAVDSDLGELELWGPLRSTEGGTAPVAGAMLAGWLRLGNVRVPCQWMWEPAASAAASASASAAAWPVLASVAPPPALGGEAALWSELIEAPQLPLRCGTALLAVAHRLWCDPAQAAGDERTLPARLHSALDWMRATDRVPRDPQQPLLQRLAPDHPEALRALILWLEPGAGYARQHAKKLTGTYHQDQALDTVADALPSESPLMPALGDDASAWLQALQALQALLPQWDCLPLPAALRPVMEGLARLGSMLWRSDAPLSMDEAGRAQQQLHEAAALVDEMVPACVNPLQRRLDARLRMPGGPA